MSNSITSGLDISNWADSFAPLLNGKPLKLEPYEMARSLAILPDTKGFLLGTEWSLVRFNNKGTQTGRLNTPGTVWGVNTAADGHVAVAALGDGTIRWYRAKDGVELLSLFVDSLTERWVIWTPSGYYSASPGGEDLFGWQINGKTADDPVDFFPASRFRDEFYRPDVIKLVLEIRDESLAIKKANRVSGRKPAALSRSSLPPVVTIVFDPRGLETDASELDLLYQLRAPSGREVTKIEVRVDGRFYAAIADERLAMPTTNGDDLRSFRISVPRRDAEVSFVAFHGDDAGAPGSVGLVWKGPIPETTKSTLRTLLVGVSVYEDKTLSLQFADDDARELANILHAQEGRFFKKVETTLLLNSDATRDRIDQQLALLASETGPDDYALVFLAGHGTTLQDRFFFMPVGARLVDGRLIEESGLSGAALLKSLNLMKGRVLFFVDACNSAGVMNLDSTGLINSVTSEENSVVMYSSSQASEPSFENARWGNGAFTEALLRIVDDPKSYDDQKEIKTDHLADILRERVRELTLGRQTPASQASRAVRPFPVARW